MSKIVQPRTTDVHLVFPQDDKARLFLTKSAGPEAVSQGALNLDWCAQYGEYMRNLDLVQSSAKCWERSHSLPSSCPTKLILIGYLNVDTQLNVVLTSTCWKHTIRVCISPFPHPYLYGGAVWMKSWTYVPSSDNGHFEVQLNDVVQLMKKTRPSILNCPTTYNHVTGVIRAFSHVMKTTSGASRFFVELNILKSDCNAEGDHLCEPKSDRSSIVVCHGELLAYWPMLAEGVVINFCDLAVTCLPKHARRIILTSTRNSKVIPHPPNISQYPVTEEAIRKPVVVSMNEFSVGSDPSPLNLCPISYEGEISLRRNSIVLLDGLFVVRLGVVGFSHVEACLRVGARVKLSWVILVWNQKDAELLTTARTAIEVTAFSSEPNASADYRVEALFRMFPEPVQDVLFARFVESCMMSKFSILTPGKADNSNGSGKCDLHHVLYGHKSNIGVVAVLKQFARKLFPDAWKKQAPDALTKFLDPAAGMPYSPKIPRLKDLQHSYLLAPHMVCLPSQTASDAVTSVYTGSGSPCRRCGNNVNNRNIHRCRSGNILLVDILQSTRLYPRSLSLTDDSGHVILVCKSDIPPEYIGALVLLPSFAIATNAKGNLESVVVDLEEIRILMNGPNAAAQPHLTEGFACTQKGSNPVKLAENRISRALNKVERVEAICWGHRKSATKAIWTSHLLCMLFKMNHTTNLCWEVCGQLLAIRRPRAAGWSPTTAAAASLDIRVRVRRAEAHCAPALEIGKLYSFSCSLVNVQQLKCQMEQFSQAHSDPQYTGSFTIDYEQLPHIGSMDPREINEYPCVFPSSRTGALDRLNRCYDGGLQSHSDRAKISWTCITCNPLWAPLCTRKSVEESGQPMKLTGVVEGLTVTPEGIHLTICDNVLQLVSLNIRLKNAEVCRGFVRGMNVAVSAVHRRVSEDTTVLLESLETTNIVLTTTSETSFCKPCCRSSIISPWILNETFPSSCFQWWANGERSLRQTGGFRSVRLRIRKLLRLEFGDNVEREESITTNDVCICGQVQRAVITTFLADDGSCQVEMSTTNICDVFYLLDISSQQLSAIEKLENCYEGGSITEDVAKDAANFSFLQEEWKAIHKLFLKRSFRPVKVLLRTLSVPRGSESFTFSAVRFTRVAIKRKDFWTCTLNGVPTVRMLALLTLQGACRGRENEASCYTRRTVSYLDYLDHIGLT